MVEIEKIGVLISNPRRYLPFDALPVLSSVMKNFCGFSSVIATFASILFAPCPTPRVTSIRLAGFSLESWIFSESCRAFGTVPSLRRRQAGADIGLAEMLVTRHSDLADDALRHDQLDDASAQFLLGNIYMNGSVTGGAVGGLECFERALDIAINLLLAEKGATSPSMLTAGNSVLPSIAKREISKCSSV